MPGGDVGGEPPRPTVLYARDVITKASRWRVAIRLILVIPHIIALFFVAIAFFFAGLIGWFAALFTGRLPDGFQEFMSGFIRYQTRVFGYTSLLTDRYPPFALSASTPYSIEYSTTHERLNRVAVFFRIILVVPAYVVQYVVTVGGYIIGVISWFIVLIQGRMPESLFDAIANVQRYITRFNSYFWLVTPAYPAGLFNDSQATPPYGEATEVDPSQPQPPRQTAGAKKWLIAIVVVGAIAAATATSVRGFQGAKRINDLNDLRRAHNDVVFTQDRLPQCAGATDPLGCETSNAQAEADSFQNFEDTLADIKASGTGDEKDRLSDTTSRIISAFHSMSGAHTAQEFAELAASTGIDNLLDMWNDDYDDYDHALAAR